MPLDSKTRKLLAGALDSVDEHGTRGPRLLDDAQRLWNCVCKFTKMNLLAEPDLEALEAACYALQLPMRQAKPPTSGKLGRSNLRERAEQSAELLVSLLADNVAEGLLDRTTRLLQEMPHRPPVLEDARLLADVVNLDDFGVTGIVQQAIQLARQGDGLSQLADGCEKRDQYGYWEARLKDGFHFEPLRAIARKRLDNARKLAVMLAQEMIEDQP